MFQIIQCFKLHYLEVDAEKTKYLFMPHHQAKGQTHDVMISNKSIKNVTKLILGNDGNSSLQADTACSYSH